MRLLLAIMISFWTMTFAACADEWSQIGSGRLFTNDYFGDGHDRWRTGSFVYSHLSAKRPYDGAETFGELIELRFASQIIAPISSSPAPGDRPYVGEVSFGLHSHFFSGGAQIGIGADLVAIGPQTGMSELQTRFHDYFDIPQVSHTDYQLGDQFALNGTASASWSFAVQDGALLRPFVEGHLGTEDLVRIGADVIIGPVGQGPLLLRDGVTGHLYTGTAQDQTGASFVLSADIASVFDSDYLPSDRGYAVMTNRARARAGVHLHLNERASLFYGATYLSPEFKGQSEGQVVGSLKLNFNF